MLTEQSQLFMDSWETISNICSINESPSLSGRSKQLEVVSRRTCVRFPVLHPSPPAVYPSCLERSGCFLQVNLYASPAPLDSPRPLRLKQPCLFWALLVASVGALGGGLGGPPGPVRLGWKAGFSCITVCRLVPASRPPLQLIGR